MPGAVTAALAAALVVGLIVWAAGMFAVGLYTEDLCLDDLGDQIRDGSYRGEASLWPPSFECHLAFSDAEPVVVQHRVVALVRFAAVVVLPIAYVAAAASVVVWWVRRRQP